MLQFDNSEPVNTGYWLEQSRRRHDPEWCAWLDERAEEIEKQVEQQQRKRMLGTVARGKDGQLICETCIHGLHQQCECGCDCNQDDFRGQLQLVQKQF